MKPQHAILWPNTSKNPNATAAARAAGYSEARAHTQGSRLLQRIAIQVAIDARKAKSEKGSQSGR
jgi:phage terminase small subunit